MVTAFEGLVSRGKRQEVGETVRFLPELLYDAEGALQGSALGGGEGPYRGDRFEGVVGSRKFLKLLCLYIFQTSMDRFN